MDLAQEGIEHQERPERGRMLALAGLVLIPVVEKILVPPAAWIRARFGSS